MESLTNRQRDALTGVLATCAVIVVSLSASGQVPSNWVPEISGRTLDAIPHVNVLISILAVLMIGFGWNSIKRGSITTHKRAMLSASGLFVAFLVLYLLRLINLGGPSPFDGPDLVYYYIYLPILAIHIFLAIVCIPLLFDALAVALTTPRTELPTTRHPRIGKIAASLWIISYTLGIAVYILLHWV